MAVYGSLCREGTVATYNARRAPAPPPEEVEILPQVENEQQAMARRLSMAFNRETALRQMRLCDEECEPISAKQEKWMSAARELLALGITEPERFVHSAFVNSIEMDATLLHGPQANSFNGAKGLTALVNNYKKFCQRADAALEAAWQAEARQFQLTVASMRHELPKASVKRIWRCAFNSVWRAQLSPLFVYCVAYSEDLEDICHEVQHEAVQQLICDPYGYARVWKNRIPQHFIDMALSKL